MNRTEIKRDVQDTLMHHVANCLGYFVEGHAPEGWHDWTEDQQDEYRAIMQREADRIARLFGYEEAWVN